MLPSNNIENVDDLVLGFTEPGQENTKTFGLNMNTNIVGGMVDDLTALKQSIYLRLSTEADQCIIYPYTYGIYTIDLIGKPSYYVMAVIPDRIKEALLSDDRITNVSDFEFDVSGNKVHVKFVVNTIYGNIEQETVVLF